ncbi:MAG: GNAT family N-acetyltransferase [Candidatus Gracilibacteria bacterium]|nr:GNAT family N-acetyltransferase [Candidatus Gracilibacteria bacterium]MDD2909175.1 GNAT family N-acetyltransferase [Candidatus Gracilibacteria bacterium]
MKITYKTITPKELKKYQAGLLDIIDKEKKRSSEIIKSLKNSTYIIIALDGEKVIGLNQIITDKYFAAYFVNLIVDVEYRKLGIGGKIFEKTIAKAKKLKVKWMNLVPDSSHPWLNDFYAKYNFNEGIYMASKGN